MMDRSPQRSSDQLPILFEDADLLALNKPPGLLVLPDRWDASQPNLLHLLNREDAARPAAARYYVVHRLDRDTSGVILLAKSAAAHRDLSTQFAARRVRKTYEALVEGEMEMEIGLVDQPLAPHPKKKGAMTIDPTGKPAQTEYHLSARFRGFSWVRAFPRTGRTHQIRIHLKAIGHPLAVDPLYGSRTALYRSDLLAMPRRPDESPLLTRLSLHASELSFNHPKTRKHCVITAPLADDLCGVREILQGRL